MSILDQFLPYLFSLLSKSLCSNSPISRCKGHSNKLISVLCLPYVMSFWNRNNECIYSYLFLDCHYPLVKSEKKFLLVEIGRLLLLNKFNPNYPLTDLKEKKSCFIGLLYIEMLTVFFIKIGKTKEKWLVIYKVICNLKFFRTCFLDKYTDSTCRAFSSVS